MKLLQNKIYVILLFFISLINSCSTLEQPTFRELKEENDKYGTVLSTRSELIVLECEDLSHPENFYGFMIHTLGPSKEYFTFTQGNTLDKGSCFKRIKKMTSMMKGSKQIQLVGYGNGLPTEKSNRKINFVGIGEFSDSGIGYKFMALKNDRGECYDAYEGMTLPCPSAMKNPWSETK